MASRQPSLLARALEPLSSGLWTLFILWTAVVAVVWACGFGDAELREHVSNPGLQGALEFFLRWLDAVWITLAAANGYLALADAEGVPAARRWASLILAGAWVVAASSAWFGFPFGAIHYTARLGMRVGPVPFGLPLMWFAFVVGARSLAMRLAPRESHFRVSIAAAALVAITVANLDPLAWKFRALWLWRSPTAGTSAQNALTWLLVSFGFAFAMRETRVASSSAGGFPRPAIVLIAFNSVFLITHFARMLRG